MTATIEYPVECAEDIKSSRNAMLRQFLCDMEDSDCERRWQECARLMRDIPITGNPETDDRIREIFRFGYLSLGVLAAQVLECSEVRCGG